MSPSQDGLNRGERFPEKLKITALGVAYLGVGIVLFYSLATDSIQLFSAVLVGILGLVFLSLFIVIRREGLITAENKLIGVFVLVAMGLLFGLNEFTTLSSEIVFGIVFVVGVLLPHLLLRHSTYGTTD